MYMSLTLELETKIKLKLQVYSLLVRQAMFSHTFNKTSNTVRVCCDLYYRFGPVDLLHDIVYIKTVNLDFVLFLRCHQVLTVSF